MKATGASPLQAGVLAAGFGERLRTQSSPLKPLAKVGGRTLIEHVLNSMSDAGASEVVVIINEDSLAVREHVTGNEWPFALRWIVETTPSSMHSFLRLVETLAAGDDDGPFLLSTVDTVAGPQTFAKFIEKARHEAAAVTLALTSPGSDEKPLLVRCAPANSRIVALGAAATPSDQATAGLYAVRASILREAEAARREGIDALLSFLGRLLDRGYHLAGIPIARSIDVDRPRDLRVAEEFLRSMAV